MGDNASLDDFLGGESSEQTGAADGEPTDGEQPAEQSETAADQTATDTELSETEAGSDGTEPAATTYAWSDQGATCEACGETVERRWQQDGGLVCIGCKDWERA